MCKGTKPKFPLKTVILNRKIVVQEKINVERILFFWKVKMIIDNLDRVYDNLGNNNWAHRSEQFIR